MHIVLTVLDHGLFSLVRVEDLPLLLPDRFGVV
jgi:hypothetical protein